MKNVFRKKVSQIIFSSFLLCLWAFPAGAQFMVSGSDLTITSTPPYPVANQMTTLKAEIYMTDINRAEISWFVDGKLKERGVGKKEFSFRTKDLGKTSLIDIQINTSDLGQINKRIKITPTEIYLIWEADSFAPPFYKGKALNAPEAVIKVVALPNFVDSSGNQIDPENLIYKWKKDWKVIGSKSGYGKNSFSFVGPRIFGRNSITVEVESLDGNLKGKKSVSLAPKNTEIVFYENNPLLGVLYNLAITNTYHLSAEELNLIACPFFFSLQNQTDLEYNWKMNNKTLNNVGKEIIFRRAGIETGESSVSLKIQNLEKITQFAENSFRINLANSPETENYFSF